MHPLLRWGVFSIAIAGAFAAGYYLSNLPARVTAAAESGTTAVVSAPPGAPKAASLGTVIARHTMTVAHTAPARPGTMTVRATGTAPRRVEVTPPRAEPPTILLPPVAVGEAPKPSDPVDPNDPALRMIKDALNIKTTVMDKAAPPPVVLADAKKDADPTIPQPPIPMAGPPPRLDSPEPRISVGPPVIADRPASRPVPLLNNRAVELDFEVTKAGLSKVKAVELWTTRDGGTTWKQTDRMEGARPPFRTRLGSEGEYGFRLVFESESGMRTPEPKPGQPPELVMELDTTPPAIEIYPPLSGPRGTIVLRWNVADRHPDRDPAATRLEYSADGQTWQPIDRAGSADTSSYEWALPPGVPARVLLRVTARDKAGNVAVAVTNEKMSVDLVPPEGKLTGVRAQGQGPEQGPMPHEARAGSAVGRLTPPVLRAVLAALLNSPEFEPRPGPDSVSDVPRPELTVQAMHEQWCRNHELILRSLVRAESAKAWVEQVTDLTVVESPRPVFRRLDGVAAPPTSRFTPAEATFEGLTQAGTVMKLLTERDWLPSTAKPESYRWTRPAPDDRPFGGTFDVGPGFWGTPPVGMRLDF